MVRRWAAPTSLVARRVVLRDAYDVLCGAPAMQVRRDLTGGPHVGFVVGVSSCRGHIPHCSENYTGKT